MKKLYVLFLICICSLSSHATGEASTYFQIFVPPNNDVARRDVCIIVTALYDSTSFTLIDDDADGDDDDSKTGMLMKGQSYVAYIRDGGVNDDAPHPGESTTKHDGDYFTLSSSKLVVVSQSTNSDWQHDWVPATNKTSKGQKFILYVPPTSFSNRDINAYAYDDSTNITLKLISTSNLTTTGFSSIDISSSQTIFTKSINIGEDLIYNNTEGRDVLQSGATYIIQSNKDITLQYGALWQNARDGGGYVPSSSGNSSGELFYFTVHTQSSREQEIRTVSWDDNNDIQLDYFNGSSWVSVQNWSVNKLGVADWVSYSGNINKVFRISCTAGKSVSVFEANWLETGSFGTSDIASMVSSKTGNTAGNEFLVYMAPPGNESNVTNPETGLKYGYATHAYLFSKDTANVTVVDAYSNGLDFSRQYQILPGRYVDCWLNSSEYYAIYNGDGSPNSGNERPYLKITSDNEISVFNTNFNDNWMSYFGTSLKKGFTVEGQTSEEMVIPGDTVSFVGVINVVGTVNVEDAEISVIVSDGGNVIESTLSNSNSSSLSQGDIVYDSLNNQTVVTFQSVNVLTAGTEYQTETKVIGKVNETLGDSLETGSIINAETSVLGSLSGQVEQATSSNGVNLEVTNHQNLIFSKVYSSPVLNFSGNNWSCVFTDLNEDGVSDVFIPNYDDNQSGKLFYGEIVGDQSFELVSNSNLFDSQRGVVVSSVGDMDNNGFLDFALGTNPNAFPMCYANSGSTYSSFTNGIDYNKGYFHGVSWVDFDKDGLLDLYLADYMPTKFNQLLRNNDGQFEHVSKLPGLVNNYCIGGAWGDVNGDGYPDLYQPVDKSGFNHLFLSDGKGGFTEVKNTAPCSYERNTIGSNWADIDNDGDLDLFVSNASNSKNEMYLNNGSGIFTEINCEITTSNLNSHGSVWGDFNNDGYIDLYLVNDQSQPKELYLNDGDLTFTRILQDPSVAADGNTIGCAFSDMDNDGDLDLLVVTHSGEYNRLFKNNGNDKNWISFKLTGTRSNTSAIGVKVEIKTSNGIQYREVFSTSGGPSSQSDLRVHFGLNDQTEIDSVRITWPSGYYQILTSITANQILSVVEPDGGLFIGNVYFDQNLDCAWNTGEKFLSNQSFKLIETNTYVSTNKNGTLKVNLQPGTYHLISNSSGNWEMLCEDTITFSIDAIGDTVISYIALNNDVAGASLNTTMYASAQRRGFKNEFRITVGNAGVDTAFNSKVIFIKPSDTYIGSCNTTFNCFTDSCIFDIGSIGSSEQVLISFEDSVGLSHDINDTITFSAVAQTTSINLGSTEKMVLNELVVGSVDPNDKLCYVDNGGPFGAFEAEDYLNYVIRFQNIGNYMASKVEIIDTLSKSLDLNSLEILDASHRFRLTKEIGVLKWNFEDINLPDSASNLSKSNGYVRFRIKVGNEITNGEVIENRAWIKFDFNKPISTNYTSNILTQDKFNFVSGISLSVYPNPFSDEINLTLKTEKGEAFSSPIAQVKIFNMLGEEVYSSINTASIKLNAGIGLYFIKVRCENGAMFSEKIVKE